MEENQIKEIFDQFFNGLANPFYCYPIQYFQYKNYLCEVAEARKPESLDWSRVKKNPLYIFDAAFVNDGYWITVLRVINKDMDVEKTDLSDYISSLDELDVFINDKLN